MYNAKLCMARICSPSSYLVDLMDLLDLSQVVDVSCPRVEKNYGKHVTIHTANKAPTELCHFVANSYHGHSHLVHLVYHQGLLGKWTECNVQVQFPCSLEECSTCCVQSYLVSPVSPVVPVALITKVTP